MSKRTAFGILALVVLVSFGIGILIGIQLSSPNNSAIPSAETSSDQTPTRTGSVTTKRRVTTIPENVSPQRSSSGNNSMTPEHSKPEKTLEKIIKNRINRVRRDRNLTVLNTEGYPSTKLSAMASDHSQKMAREEMVSSSINGNSSADRYRRAGLFDTCKFPSNDRKSTIDPQLGRLELVANPVSTENFENTYEGYKGTPYGVAADTVDHWLNSREGRNKLTYQNARRLGVGVTITEEGSVYVDATLC